MSVACLAKVLTPGFNVCRVLMVASSDLAGDLGRTVLWRSGVERIVASDIDTGHDTARCVTPNMVVLEAERIDEASALVRRLRDDPETRATSIVVLSRLAHADDERLVAAGANLLLRHHPVDPALWDSRLAELLNVPPRRHARLPMTVNSWTSPARTERPVEGQALNVSVHGILAETADRLEVGSKLDVELRLPGDEMPMNMVGSVVRDAGPGEGSWRCGIKFLILRGDARERIADFVAQGVADPGRFPVRGWRRLRGNERSEWEAELRASEACKAAVLESVPDSIVIVDQEGRIHEANRAAERTLGYARQELVGKRLADCIAPPVPWEGCDGGLVGYLGANEAAALGTRTEAAVKRADGTQFPAELAITPIHLEGRRLFTACLRDISERRRLEQQFRQAQKMEAVGRLAGGVAHDFNNLLNVIIGFGELLRRELPPAGAQGHKVAQILKAAERATSVTRQLLAFSRRQVLQPRLFDLNAVVTDTARMLRPLIGEDVRLAMTLAPALGRLKADPGQIELVLMNLMINARDAMPGGGALFIETSNVDLDEAYARDHVGARPGPYVVLKVADSGVGMDTETQRHIFEPFFTTKEPGRGTGLGLATVYGIVKQSGGYIWVESVPCHGTTFSIFLPRVEPEADAEPKVKERSAAARGQETLLLVEDEDVLRDLTREVLEAAGYRVLSAASGEEALGVASLHAGGIDLLVSDVIMPGMSGAELARRLGPVRPQMKVLFASGYTADAIAHHGVLEDGTEFLQKPFTPGELESKVRAVLDGATAEVVGGDR